MSFGHKFCWCLNFIALMISGSFASPVLAADPPEWSEQVKPFRITSNVYYVGTKGLAAYLILSESGAILIDGTLARNTSQIERNIESVGVPLHRVKILLSDHAHADHVGAMAQIKRDTGARFLASAGDRWALENGQNQGDNNYGTERFAPINVDGIVSDGEVIRLGEVALTAHLTPGHTPGCTSWSMSVNDRGVWRRVLFLCSITVAGNTLIGNQAYPEIVRDYEATFAKLAAMRADIVLTSHPEMADVLGRQARRKAGKQNAFIDPQLLSAMVARYRADFEVALTKARNAARRP